MRGCWWWPLRWSGRAALRRRARLRSVSSWRPGCCKERRQGRSRLRRRAITTRGQARRMSRGSAARAPGRGRLPLQDCHIRSEARLPLGVGRVGRRQASYARHRSNAHPDHHRRVRPALLTADDPENSTVGVRSRRTRRRRGRCGRLGCAVGLSAPDGGRSGQRAVRGISRRSGSTACRKANPAPDSSSPLRAWATHCRSTSLNLNCRCRCLGHRVNQSGAIVAGISSFGFALVARSPTAPAALRGIASQSRRAPTRGHCGPRFPAPRPGAGDRHSDASGQLAGGRLVPARSTDDRRPFNPLSGVRGRVTEPRSTVSGS